jgi:hypothetical protein
MVGVDTNGTMPFAALVSNVTSMIQTLGKVDAILFHQGESDNRQTVESAEEYKRSLRDMLTRALGAQCTLARRRFVAIRLQTCICACTGGASL